ncbi:hypothetical protein AKJ09_08322 [Labilithrix luteola]|uniref:Uncharacterized protein n=1 Tax=Labilithrix luteola TaxID=1391654 RepID=A0A0K1Q7F2_9BACT|nr:hypothetical protein [Labilithrix luteola]AKV01659.1 hypothetical protein AKJ09_08322 [Labilithrix luteola]
MNAAESKEQLLARLRAIADNTVQARPATDAPSAARARSVAPEARAGAKSRRRKVPPPPSISRGDDDRVWIHETPDEVKVTDETVAAIATKAPSVFRMGQTLGEVEDAEFRPAASARVIDLASSVAVYFHESNDDGEVRETPVHPPRYLGERILARPSHPGVRVLEGIVRSPILRTDGSVCSIHGFDAQSKLFYAPTIAFPEVPSSASLDEAVAAYLRLSEPFADFPYEDRELGIACAISAILTLLSRHLIGLVPVKCTSASSPGSGKGLEADTITMIGLGVALPRSPWSADAEEQRKMLDGHARRNELAILLDNIVCPLGGASLERNVTSTVVDVRVLGRSETVSFPWRATVLANGNNIRFAGDMPRRTYLARIVPQDDRPDQRTNFRLSPLLDHVRINRARYVIDALTILSAHAKAGRPRAARDGGWGSFEEWTSVVADAVVFAGGRDPLGARVVRDAKTDTVREALDGLIRIWRAFGGAVGIELACAQVIERCGADDEARAFLDELLDEQVPSRSEKQTKAARLSVLLSRNADRWTMVDGSLLGFVQGSAGRFGRRWKLSAPRGA